MKTVEALTLNITEIFRSIQGETSLTGMATTFIRLASCNLRCSWCDTPYSFGKGETKSLDEILAQVESFRLPYICVTGGEPLLQKTVHLLLGVLCDQGYIVNLETSGSLTTKEVDPRVITILDIKCPASGMSHKNHWSNLSILRDHDEVKFVLQDKGDYIWAKEVCEKYSLFERRKPVLFSPVHGRLDPKTLVEWILDDQVPVRLNLQIHKWIWSPNLRGV